MNWKVEAVRVRMRPGRDEIVPGMVAGEIALVRLGEEISVTHAPSGLRIGRPWPSTGAALLFVSRVVLAIRDGAGTEEGPEWLVPDPEGFVRSVTFETEATVYGLVQSAT